MFLSVKVSPKSKLNQVTQSDDSHFTIHTTAAPDKGKANESVLKLLSAYLKVPKSRLTIVKGEASRQKLIAIK
ncbi:MAG TPA: DUF167 domain-containing protein [Patescibacteria group bacterium]|nr:DUF167 domain-containing protein [Patescibacteria group bacterium]